MGIYYFYNEEQKLQKAFEICAGVISNHVFMIHLHIINISYVIYMWILMHFFNLLNYILVFFI